MQIKLMKLVELIYINFKIIPLWSCIIRLKSWINNLIMGERQLLIIWLIFSNIQKFMQTLYLYKFISVKEYNLC